MVEQPNIRKIAVLVAGSWGTALSTVLADNQFDISLWSNRPEQVAELNGNKRNDRYVSEHSLPERIVATISMADAVRGAEAVVIAAPSSAMAEVAGKLATCIEPQQLIIHVTKGFELERLLRMSEVIAEQIPAYPLERIVVLSGPSHAEEVMHRKPTTVVAAAQDEQAAKDALSYFINENFRVYLSDDPVGVELGGSLKNIIALAAGMSDGLQLGDNAKAALVTRGLSEIVSLGSRLGGQRQTFYGLAGLGDLFVTCGSPHSRNYQAGLEIGRGGTIVNGKLASGMVVEGINATRAAHRLAERFEISMPIVEQLYEVLYNQKSPQQAVYDLMTRDPRPE